MLRIILIVFALLFTLASGYHMVKNWYIWEINYAYSLICALGLLMLMMVWISE